MNNSIANIKNYFTTRNGLQRNNRYKVLFYGVELLPGSQGSEEFFSNSVSIGPRAIDSVADNLSGYGFGRSIPRGQRQGGYANGGVLITFPVTNDSHILTFFDSWFNSLYSGSFSRNNGSGKVGYAGAPFLANFYDNVVAPISMQVILMNPNGDANCSFTFLEVYPMESFPIALEMNKVNEYSTYQVNFNYREMIFNTPSY